jgi:hypothetical protein
MPPVPKVDQGQVTTAIAAGRSAAHGHDAAAAEALRLARLGAPDAVTFLRNVVRAERSATVAQRVRSAVAVLEVGGFLSETRSSGAFREPEGTDAGAEAGETS